MLLLSRVDVIRRRPKICRIEEGAARCKEGHTHTHTHTHTHRERERKGLVRDVKTQQRSVLMLYNTIQSPSLIE